MCNHLKYRKSRYSEVLIYERHEKGKKLVKSNFVLELEFVYKGDSEVRVSKCFSGLMGRDFKNLKTRLRQNSKQLDKRTTSDKSYALMTGILENYFARINYI